MMECLIGVRFNDFVLLATDTQAISSIISLKKDFDKMFRMSRRVLMGVCGEQGDAVQFAEFIQQNMQLYEIRNGYELSPKSAAYFTRKNLADSLRSQSPYAVNVLIAGYDEETGPEMYFADYLGALVKVPYAIHGYGGLFTYGILDRYYNPNMDLDSAINLVKICVKEINKRFLVNLERFKLRQVTKDGIKDLADLNIEPCQA
ncbi:unnamed protein product [Protopolystoma xenopodis]|uniref:Proteasome subunit beta n=1 Tax=Protopolystoma xenopodis TaxID=117903 RepID=A0A3S5AA77_9PLAT|nr:unnamed protein product [Protopolystoma xenopodis]